MSGAPRFGEEWLQAYNERLRAMSSGRPSAPRTPAARQDARPASRRAPPRAQEGPENAAAGARAEATALVPYRPVESVVAPLRGWNGKQTKTEERYNRDVLGGMGRFEAVTLHLPGGGRYTPDFMTVDDGVVTFHEVKGSYRLGSQGRAWTAFREAAAAFPLWRFVWAAERARGDGGGFSTKVFNSAAMGEGAA